MNVPLTLMLSVQYKLLLEKQALLELLDTGEYQDYHADCEAQWRAQLAVVERKLKLNEEHLNPAILEHKS